MSGKRKGGNETRVTEGDRRVGAAQRASEGRDGDDEPGLVTILKLSKSETTWSHTEFNLVVC